MCMNFDELIFFNFSIIIIVISNTYQRILLLQIHSFYFFSFLFNPFSHLNFNIFSFNLFTPITSIVDPPIHLFLFLQSTLLTVRVKKRQLSLATRPCPHHCPIRTIPKGSRRQVGNVLGGSIFFDGRPPCPHCPCRNRPVRRLPLWQEAVGSHCFQLLHAQSLVPCHLHR